MSREKQIILVGWVFVSLFCLVAALPQQPVAAQPRSYAGPTQIDQAKDHFCIVSDTQKTSRWEFWRERNEQERKLILDGILRRDPAFIINLGDLTTRGSSETHWREFDESHKALREKNIPYFPLLGNHEFYGNNEAALRNFFERFPHLENRRWYSLTWKNIGLIFLDSNFGNLNPEELKTQSEWYLGELERLEKDGSVDYIIACCHGAPFTNSRTVGPNDKSKTYFAEPFTRFRKTTLFFSGHSHSYERFQFGSKTFIVSGGGGGPRHKLYVDPRGRRFEDLFAGPELRFFHYCELAITEGALTFRVYRLESDGMFTVVDPLSFPRVR
jgi:hypothetical protein